MNSKIKILLNTSILKTIRVNFHYLRPRDAIKFPILISRASRIRILKGSVQFDIPIKSGIIKFGYDTLGFIDYGHQRALWANRGNLVFKGSCSFGAATKLVNMAGEIIIGQNVLFSGDSKIICDKRIEFGDGCIISWDVLIMDTDFHRILSKSGPTNPPKGITIGSHVWIGCGCQIFKGSEIPNGCILGASSSLFGILKRENCVYGGNPVRILKENISWDY